jgi:hypothetical protein
MSTEEERNNITIAATLAKDISDCTFRNFAVLQSSILLALKKRVGIQLD